MLSFLKDRRPRKSSVLPKPNVKKERRTGKFHPKISKKTRRNPIKKGKRRVRKVIKDKRRRREKTKRRRRKKKKRRRGTP